MLTLVDAPTVDTAPREDSEPVGIGVIGLGAFGRFCLEAYLGLPTVRVVAIADPDPLALAVGAQLAPAATPYLDAALLLAQPNMAVVTICTTPDRHVGLVLAAILAGTHVVCDKPLGLFLSEFDTAVAAAKAHCVVLGLNLVLRHHSLYAFLHALAGSGALGPLRRLAVENYAEEARGFGAEHWLWNPARSGGLALAADIRWLDLAVRLLGRRTRSMPGSLAE